MLKEKFLEESKLLIKKSKIKEYGFLEVAGEEKHFGRKLFNTIQFSVSPESLLNKLSSAKIGDFDSDSDEVSITIDKDNKGLMINTSDNEDLHVILHDFGQYDAVMRRHARST